MSIESLCRGDIAVKQTAAHSRGPSGDAVRTYTDTATLDCLIQTTSAGESTRYAAQGSRFTHTAFFAADPALTTNHRLKQTVKAGATLTAPIYLRVLACYSEGRPGKDLLWIADCEQVTTESPS